jgi:hypothetical protein
MTVQINTDNNVEDMHLKSYIQDEVATLARFEEEKVPALSAFEMKIVTKKAE